MRILVTGASGMLGRALINKLQQTGFEYMATDVNDVSSDVTELDITDFTRVMSAVKDYRPDVVINAAAFTDVDGCEADRDTAFRVNALGPRNLAVACEDVGAALVQISTDYVFSGQSNTPYNEYSPTGPLNVYGWSKLAGEMNVCHHTKRFYIVRTAWLFGRWGKNFVSTILRLAKEQRLLSVVDDQVGSPTYAADLAKAIVQLIKEPSYGIYHITNSGTCSWYRFAQVILEEAGIDNVELRPVSTRESNRLALRPANSVLENHNWVLHGNEPLRHYREALQEYIKEESK
ncbi:dTDP-4-dehydrorhamnose reductase [Thermincola ferriacetica]|uniref:dTDP-4-dehydrorhamnose reductase n=1 Tax=Thermincola ferriacetica TaxID=281456 RepID=UPI00069182EB